MAHAEALERLLSALKDLDSTLGDKDVRWAFQSPQTREAVVTWVQTNLRSETLLSRDELILYETIQNTAAGRKFAASASSSVKPISEDEIQTAVTDLEVANDTIKAQTNILKRQIENLRATVSEEAGLQARQAQIVSSRSRKLTQERQDLAFKIELEVEDLTARLAAVEHVQSSKSNEIRGHILRTLKADDQSLAALPVPANSQSNQANPQELLYELANKLQSSNETLIRNHLDRVYLEALVENLTKPDASSSEVEKKDVDGVSADLESLYSEIASVAAISVQANLLGPMLQLIQPEQDLTGIGNLENIAASIESLTIRLKKISQRLKLQLVNTEATKILASTADSLLREIKTAQAEATSVLNRRHSSSFGKSPVRTKRLRQNSFTQDDRDVHLASLTRQLGLSKLTTTGFAESEKTVEGDVIDMQRKLRQQLEVLESSAGDLFLAHVKEIDEVEQTLANSLQSSSIDSKSLPQQLTELIDQLQEKLDRVAQGMGALQLDDRPASGLVDTDFVKKWSKRG